jgi:hypothetical protein
MILSDEPRRSRPRLFVSGIALLGFGLSLCSVGLIVGCDDGKSKMTQVEDVKPAEKAKGSMDFYRAERLKQTDTTKK